MDETKVETEVTESTQTSTPPPATTPAPDIEALKAAAKEEARRELQSAKDREIAGLHKQYQEREAALRAKARQRLARHDENDAAQLDRELDVESRLSRADAILQQQDSEMRARQHASGLAQAYGLEVSDPRISKYETWDEFHVKAKAAVAEDARKEREAAKKADADTQRKKVDGKVDSGELSGLDLKPTGAAKATLEEDYKRELSKIPRGQVKALTELKFKYRKKGLAI